MTSAPQTESHRGLRYQFSGSRNGELEQLVLLELAAMRNLPASLQWGIARGLASKSYRVEHDKPRVQTRMIAVINPMSAAGGWKAASSNGLGNLRGHSVG